ncbi:hypothetical protein DXG01_005281 [Tephrocybe rancida]|nr:hypothetical protein DXG01_005281 [Tephrocybe rancida]
MGSDAPTNIRQNMERNEGGKGNGMGSGSRKRACLHSPSNDESGARLHTEQPGAMGFGLNIPDADGGHNPSARASPAQDYESDNGEDDPTAHALPFVDAEPGLDVPDDNDLAADAIAQAQAILGALNNGPEPPIGLTEDEDDDTPKARIESLQITQEFICLIKEATLENNKLDSDTLARLRNPIEGCIDISNPDDRLSIEIFTATDATESTYT